MTVITALDIAAMITALIASALWYQASSSTVRRISATEQFDYHDMNRLITAYNRTQIFNARAALATAISALMVAARFGANLLGY
jgi:hypothetical protein